MKTLRNYIDLITENAQGILGVGSQGPEVTALQKSLGVAADGVFGPVTQQAVIALQKKLGVTADGAYGPVTRAAHMKMQDGPGAAAPAPAPQPAHTTGATADQVQTVAAKQVAGRAELAAQTTDPDRTSLSNRVTTATPVVPVNPANPGGVSSKMAIAPDQAQAILDNGSERDITAFGGREKLQQLAGAQVAPAPAPQPAPAPAPAPAPQPAPAPAPQAAPPGETAGGAATARPVRPATGARAQMLARQQAQNQMPESQAMDGELLKELNAMRRIAGLKDSGI